MKLSAPIRDLLIQHIDGPVPFVARFARVNTKTMHAALARGFLRPDGVALRDGVRLKQTFITEAGRAALAAALADWAEALIQAGFGVEEAVPGGQTDLAFLRKWAENRKPAPVSALKDYSHIS